jgi:antitoxin HigA-1
MGMYNPAHPGAVLKDIMGKTSISELARHLGIPRENLSKIIHGRQSVSPAVAWKLAQAFPNSDAQMWLALQNQYDLAQIRKKKPKAIKPLSIAA